MKQCHTFIDRNFLIYKAVCDPVLSERDEDRLYRNGLRASALDGSPDWLKKWAALICEYLEYEEKYYPEFYRSEYPAEMSVEDIAIDAKLQKETQI